MHTLKNKVDTIEMSIEQGPDDWNHHQLLSVVNKEKSNINKHKIFHFIHYLVYYFGKFYLTYVHGNIVGCASNTPPIPIK